MSYSDKQKKILNKRYKKNIWNYEEKCFRARTARRKPKLTTREIPLSLVFETTLKLSVFGRFMHQFNPDQNKSCMVNENKLLLEKYNMKHFTKRDQKDWDFWHGFSENLFELLEKSIEEQRHIDLEYFQDELEILRLNNSPITIFGSLKKFVRLKILTLGANWIKLIEGKHLPRNLEMLELFSNEISCLKSFCMKCSKRLKYLGLGRNLLNEDSSCHLLVSSRNFQELKALDLSNNNFQNIREIVHQIGGLKSLRSLSLEGNPCYTTEDYPLIVLKCFPKLKFLDDMEVLEEDKIPETAANKDSFEAATKGSFIFTCYKLLGLPKPPKGKKILHTFHIEVELPFLQELVREKEKSIHLPSIDETPNKKIKPSVAIITEPKASIKEVKKGKKDKKEKTDKKSKSKKKGSVGSKKSISLKPIQGTGIYALPDETYAKNNHHHKTEERLYAKSIKFDNPCIIAVPPKNDLTLLRDTFRSQIKVNIVYVQKAPPPKPKKLGKNQKPKLSTSSLLEPPKDITLKTSTFASFYCDLKNVNWSEEYVDFIWSNTPKFGKHAFCVPGSLKPEIFADKKRTKQNLPVKARKLQIHENADPNKKELPILNEFEPLPMPTTLTCLVGFGLWRNGMIQELVVEEKKGTKK